MSRFFRRAGDSDDSDSETEESSEESLLDSDEEAEAPKPAAKRPIGMARFLKGAAGSGSSSSESSDEEDGNDDAFLVGDGGSESDEDVKKVVKSASAKRMDEMEGVGKIIENALKINDWVAISNGALYTFVCLYLVALTSFVEFDKLVRMVERQLNLSEKVPSFYIKTLVGLEQSLNSAVAKEKEAKKKMNATNARALNTMKQRVKKTTKEYEKEVKLFQEVRAVSSSYLVKYAYNVFLGP